MKKIIILVTSLYILTDFKNLFNLYSVDKILFYELGIFPVFYILAIGSIILGLVVLFNFYFKKLNRYLLFRNYFIYQIVSTIIFFAAAFIDIQKTNEILNYVSSLKTDNVDKINFMTVQILIPGFILITLFNLFILYMINKKKYFLE